MEPKYTSLTLGQDKLTVRYIDIQSSPGIPLLYLHGWGCNYQLLLPLIEPLVKEGRHIAIDFPGFGESNRPKAVWGTEDYADFTAEFLKAVGIETCIAIGHSFGGRVAVQVAKRHPDTLIGMVLIASAGLKRNAPYMKRLKVKSVRGIARLAKRIIPGTLGSAIKEKLYNKIASRDWLQAGEMRDIFVKVVNEDLSVLLPAIETPALLLWGKEDQETPVELGRKMHDLLPHSSYLEFPGFDHYTILSRGRHQIAYQIKRFMQELLPAASQNVEKRVT